MTDLNHSICICRQKVLPWVSVDYYNICIGCNWKQKLGMGNGEWENKMGN